MTDVNHPRLEVIHHADYDTSVFTPYIPAIRVRSGDLVFISAVTAAPVYHDQPQRPRPAARVPTSCR
jgi:hypothetical protein